MSVPPASPARTAPAAPDGPAATAGSPAPDPAERPGGRRPPELTPRELGRWAWRQLTSMRNALLLLLVLALAAVPGSLVPQQGVDSIAVARFRIEHPDLAPWLDRLGVFSVYSSPWFSAVYLLLLVSVIGCIVPRTAVYARALRARPPSAPQRLERLPAFASYESAETVEAVIAGAERVLRAQRFRVDSHAGTLSAEKGYLREAGNLVFHASLVVVLVGVAIGSLWGYRGNAIVVEGSGFSNTLTQYDEFSAGALAGASSLPPFTVALEAMTADFQTGGSQAGQPKSFEATGTLTPAPGADPAPFGISVNHPLTVEGTSVFLVGSGYAPVVTVRDGAGEVVSSGPVPFLPADSSYLSEGVVKVPDASPEQLGLEGFFLPTAARGADGVPVSAFPEAVDPVLSLFVWRGDLGLDDGVPQSIYALDKDELSVVEEPGGGPTRLLLRPGQTAPLPDGLGSVSFDGVREFARLQISSAPLAWLPLTALVVAVSGLLLSLYVRPRRAWVRARSVDGRTVVEVAALDRVARADTGPDLDEVVAALRARGRSDRRDDPAATDGDRA